MTSTYTTEHYTTTDGARTISTSEYRFDDGTRFVQINTRTPKPDGVGHYLNTRVLRADFEGDTEHRSTIAELATRRGHAEDVTPAPEARELTSTEKREAALAQGMFENAVEPFVIEAGYEEQAVPLTERQIAVLDALHENLNITVPLEVLPPVKGNRDLTASAQWANSNRFLVEVDPEGYINRVAVRYDIAGHGEWADLSRSDRSTYFYDRVKLLAREARLATPINSVGTNAAE